MVLYNGRSTMVSFIQVTKDDFKLNMQIEVLNKMVFPSTKSTDDLHFLADFYQGASVDFIAIMDEERFVGYAYMVNFFQASYVVYLAIRPDYQGNGYGSILLNHLREIQGERPIVLTANALGNEDEDLDISARRRWFYVRNGYIDQHIPFPSHENHRSDVYMNGFGLSYIEIMATLDKVNTFFNTLIVPRNNFSGIPTLPKLN